MNNDYKLMITRFPLFHGPTSEGAQMLLDCGEVSAGISVAPNRS